LVSQPVFTNIEQSVDCVVDVGFRKFISNVKVLTFERKISKFVFRNRISKLIPNVKGAYDLHRFQKDVTFQQVICRQVVSIHLHLL